MKKYFICLIALAVWPRSARAGAAVEATAGNSFFELLFGTPDQENAAVENSTSNNAATENCSAYGGVVGAVDTFFCHMEQDMGITGPGAATKIYGNIEVHAEIVKTTTTIGATTYDYQGEVWVCDTSTSDCTQTANYSRAYYIAYNFDQTSGVNQGFMLTDPGAVSGSPGSMALQVSYDLGSNVSTKTISMETTFLSGTTTYNMWAKGQKTSTLMQVDVASYDSTDGGVRFAVSTAPGINITKYYNMYYEGSAGSGTGGYYSTDYAGITSAPPTANGLCVQADDAGSSLSSTTVTSSNCSSLPFMTFDDFSLSADGSPNVETLSTTSILTPSGGTLWNGMAANPSSL